MIQSSQCNPTANPRICTTATIAMMVTMAKMATAIMTVTRASRAMKDTVTRDHYSHGSHDAHGVTTVIRAIVARMAKTATTVTMTTTATTGTATSRSWLHKISGARAPISWSLNILHLRLNVCSQVGAPLEDQRIYISTLDASISWKSAHLEYTIQVGARIYLRSTYLHPSDTSTPYGLMPYWSNSKLLDYQSLKPFASLT